MIAGEVFMDILSYYRQGFSLRAISRKLGIHRETVKKYVSQPQSPRYHKTQRKDSILSPFHQMIDDWLAQDDYRGTWIYQRIKNLGYAGGYDTVKHFVRSVKARNRRQAYIRFETIPGLQGQVDWGDFKVVVPGAADLTLYLFVLVLGYSRAMYAEFVVQCTLQAFMDVHIRALKYLGGVPFELLYDNMRHVFAGRHNGKPVVNVEFTHFAAHYGFKPVLCPPYSPWVKGKVERPMDYIREAFWRGYRFTDIETANRDLLGWLSDTANRRVHGTLRQPVDMRWQQEAKSLSPVMPDYDTAIKVYRKVYKDCMVAYDTSRYQVPPEAVGKKVLLKIKDGLLRIYDDDRLLKTYALSEEKGRWVTDPAITEQILDRRREQAARPPYGRNKGKATTRGLVNASLFPQVSYRPLAVYEQLAQNGGGVWTS